LTLIRLSLSIAAMNANPAMSKLEPAYSVIRKFDTDDQRGTEVLGVRLGVVRSAVTRWTLAREKGGTGGYIPPRYYDEILSFAKERGVSLNPSEFVVSASGNREGRSDCRQPQGELVLQAAE
jgi:hypothetical protein